MWRGEATSDRSSHPFISYRRRIIRADKSRCNTPRHIPMFFVEGEIEGARGEYKLRKLAAPVKVGFWIFWSRDLRPLHADRQTNLGASVCFIYTLYILLIKLVVGWLLCVKSTFLNSKFTHTHTIYISLWFISCCCLQS